MLESFLVNSLHPETEGIRGESNVQTCWHVETEGAGFEAESADQLTRLMDDHLRRTYTQIYRIVRNAADAQDLTQEAFIKAWRRRDQLRDGQRADAWLASIARNTAIDFLRRKSPVSEGEGVELERSHGETPEQILLRSEKRSRLSEGLRRLTEREQMALILRDVEELEPDEVARILGCSKATVRCHIANAREKFRRYLKQEDLRQYSTMRNSVL